MLRSYTCVKTLEGLILVHTFKIEHDVKGLFMYMLICHGCNARKGLPSIHSYNMPVKNKRHVFQNY